MFRKYSWIKNQISDDDMNRLYQIKQEKGIPITKLVAKAVKEFIKKTETEKEV